jgi:hypothetical protein
MNNLDYNTYKGKIISVKINDRDERGFKLHDKFTFIKGYCTFSGYNEILDKNQVTINRMPIFEEDIFDIIVID